MEEYENNDIVEGSETSGISDAYGDVPEASGTLEMDGEYGDVPEASGTLEMADEYGDVSETPLAPEPAPEVGDPGVERSDDTLLTEHPDGSPEVLRNRERTAEIEPISVQNPEREDPMTSLEGWGPGGGERKG